MAAFLRSIWPFARPYRVRLILGLACGILCALANGGGWLLNAGSVGQSRERLARARCLLLDLKRREATFG